MLARFLIARPALADRVSWAGVLSMGFFSSLLVFTVLRDLVLVLLIGVRWPPLAQMSAVLVPLLALLVTLIGFVNARRLPRVVTVEIPLANLPAQLIGFTIVQLSDIHVGPTIKRDYVQAIVNRVNQLNADLVAITGDVVDGRVADLSPHTAPLAELAARHGTFFVTGNHEYYSGSDEWVTEFARLGMRVLMNEHAVITHDGAQLVVAGVTDYSAQFFDPAQRSDPERAAARQPGRRAESVAGASAALGQRGGGRRLRPAALRPHAWRAVLAVAVAGSFAAAVHGRFASPRQTVGVHQPRHRLLGAAQTLRRAGGDYPHQTGPGQGQWLWMKRQNLHQGTKAPRFTKLLMRPDDA